MPPQSARVVEAAPRQAELSVADVLAQHISLRGGAAAVATASTAADVLAVLRQHPAPLPGELALQGVLRVNRLAQRRGGEPPADERAAFGEVRALAFAALHAEGGLSAERCVQLLEASAWLALPLAPQQQAAVDAAACAAAARPASPTWQRLLNAYAWLGIAPGRELAASMAPPMCLKPAEVRRRLRCVRCVRWPGGGCSRCQCRGCRQPRCA